MYSAAVLERVRNPQRVGVLPEDSPDVGTGQCGTLDAGTMARIQIRVKDGRIVETGSVRQVFGDPQHAYTRALLDAAPDATKAVAG